MFWNSSEVKHSRFDPKYILDSGRDVVSIWRNDGGISIFFEALDEEGHYSVLHINIADPIKRSRPAGYFTFDEADKPMRIQCLNQPLTAAESTVASIKTHLEQYNFGTAFNITKDQTENLIPCINCLDGLPFFAGESLEKIRSCFRKIDSSFSVDLVEITSVGCVVF